MYCLQHRERISYFQLYKTVLFCQLYKTVLPSFKLDMLMNSRSVDSKYVKINAEVRNFLHLVNLTIKVISLSKHHHDSLL